MRVGGKTLWFLNTSLKQAPQMSRLAARAAAAGGHGTELSHAAPARRATARRPADSLIGINAEQAIARGILCAGNPDTVYKQIMDIYDKVGGFGHFIFIGRSGFLTTRRPRRASGSSPRRCCRGCPRQHRHLRPSRPAPPSSQWERDDE